MKKEKDSTFDESQKKIQCKHHHYQCISIQKKMNGVNESLIRKYSLIGMMLLNNHHHHHQSEWLDGQIKSNHIQTPRKRFQKKPKCDAVSFF